MYVSSCISVLWVFSVMYVSCHVMDVSGQMSKSRAPCSLTSDLSCCILQATL
jgi:hypothetical protein